MRTISLEFLEVERENILGIGLCYVYEPHYEGGQRYFSVDKLCRLLPGAGLLQVDLRNRVGPSDRGRDFVRWMLERGHKAKYFKSDLGSWGDGPTGTFSTDPFPPSSLSP